MPLSDSHQKLYATNCYKLSAMMEELEAPNRALLKDAPAGVDDLESQHSITDVARRHVFHSNRPEWYRRFHLSQVSKLTRPVTLHVLRQSMHEAITRAALPERASLPTSAIVTGRPLSLSHIEPQQQHDDSTNKHRTQHIDVYCNNESEASRSRRPSSSSDSFVSRKPSFHDKRQKNHKERKKMIKKLLGPLLPLKGAPRNRFVLMCWQDSDQCRVKSVLFEHTFTEATMWSSIHDAWSVTRSPLQSLLQRFRAIKKVEIVTVGSPGLVKSPNCSVFLTVFAGSNSRKARYKRNAKQENARQIIAGREIFKR